MSALHQNNTHNSDCSNVPTARGCNYFLARNQAIRNRQSTILLKPDAFQVLTAPTAT